MRNQKGFSLIELLIVVAVILVITAIAIPAVTASIQAGNETAATSTMKAVVTANTGYRNLFPTIGFAALATNLGEGGTSACPDTPDPTGLGACLMAKSAAAQLDAGTLSGYNFKYTVTNGGGGYTITATPASTSKGRKAFFADQSGAISYAYGLVPPVSVTAGTLLGQ